MPIELLIDVGSITLLALAAAGHAAVLHKREAATCVKDSCLELFQRLEIVAKPFCSAYTHSPTHPVPAFAARWSDVPAKISSACACLNGGKPTAPPSSTSAIISTPVCSQTVVTTVAPSATTPPSSTTSPTADACYVTKFSAIPAATAACTDITLDGITVPGNSTIDLSKLKKGTKVTFKGKTFWEYFDANYPFIKVGGTDLEITAAEGAVLDGNGQAWWDGIGSNGGVKK
jgi:polygalacturonase